jgi:hypothetical protein
VDNLHKMLKLAVIEQDEDAIATLSAIRIIAIDEDLCSSCYCSERRHG